MSLKVTLTQRGLCWGVLLLLVALPLLQAHARVHHTEAWARERYAAADRMREALNGRPPAERTRRDYQRVINAFRNVYYGAPTSTKADPSAVAVAETLVEMGRRFEDDKILNGAIAQYKFLRKEYPGSKYRCDALFTIGEIYKDDLNDPEQARATFEEFVRRYTHNRLVEDAQQAIAEMKQEAEAEKKAEATKKPGKEVGAGAGDKGKDAQDSAAKEAETQEAAAPDAGDAHAKRFPRVTAIRHWSTPDYTRVAIDIEGEIKFGSQRIANPDRIFFDLKDTKLASTLVGKSFDVDDGFLKKIRVAQFQPGRTRVVLEVDDLSTYEAFLLPNPYRLIIDIHGKDDKVAHAKLTKEEAATLADVEVPPQVASKAQVSKPVVKADMKALAGKPASKKEQVHNDPDAAAKADGAGSGAHAANEEEKTRTADTKAAPAVKKVIVDNDDDDDPAPAATAKAETRAGRSHSSAAAHKTESVPDDDTVAAAKAADDPPATIRSGKSASKTTASRKSNDLDIRVAKPTASGDRSLIRTLGLKIGKIVIDPGHGGHDTGTIGPNGLEEKDLVLEVGRRLGKMLETRLGAEVVYTRKDDTFIPLETRTAIANQQRADLFISIHANSSRDEAARGVETYYLNFTSSQDALEVAARENAVSEKSIYELQDLVKKIAMKEKIEESREFAGDVQQSLHSGLAAKNPGIRNRGVKKAPFIVLIGANMPSILAEISFVSNPGDEHRLETSEYRQRIAESLYRGIAKYVDGLSGVKMASKLDKAAGQ
ncbi:MAG TPA: N-acetylmuramoyl-L-alanine amidase [Candidatus Dormibacteraeota bacterium]|nr:N-acetylmuramoyl-L-alanine amidase [Candidatus Dormibacteraeota bacterium]